MHQNDTSSSGSLRRADAGNGSGVERRPDEVMADRRSTAQAGDGDRINPADWALRQSPDALIASATSSEPRRVELTSEKELQIHGLEPDGKGSEPLVAALQARAEAPELEGIRAIFVVDEPGHFLDPSGERSVPIQALPPDARGRLIVARKTAGDGRQIDQLLATFIERERLARTGEACQIRERTTLGRDGVDSSHVDPPSDGAGHGQYQGRPIIGRDAQITGGVYLSGSENRPAIVVDHTRDHRLRRLFRELVSAVSADDSKENSGLLRSISSHFSRSAHSEEENGEPRVLRQVHVKVRERLPVWDPDSHEGRSVDEEVMAAIARRGETVRSGQKIYLGEYLRIASADGQGGGDCVHQSLLVGHLLERLSEEGLLEGSVSFERNMIQGLGAHAWIRFSAANGKLWVLDTVHDYLGPVDGPSNWIYLRREDIQVLRNRPL